MTDVEHTDSGLVAAHRMASWAIMFPWASIFALPQMVLVERVAMLFVLRKGVAGDEAAWDTSCHRMNLQRPALEHHRFRLACEELP